jgi:Zn-dependent protease
VPVNQRMLRNPRSGMMIVAMAGPGSNLLLAAVAAIGFGLLAGNVTEAPEPGGALQFLVLNLQNFIGINVFLALFNLLPIPPFDGSHVVEGLLPRAWIPAYHKLRPLGFPLVFILLIGLPWLIPSFDPVGTLVGPPYEWMMRHYAAIAQAVAG